MPDTNSVEKGLREEPKVLAPERVVTPVMRYEKALEKAQALISEALNKNPEKSTLGAMSPSSAVVLLDKISWDRNHTVPLDETQDGTVPKNRLVQVPDEVFEAQRLIYESYKPTSQMETLQRNVFAEVMAHKGKTLEHDIDIWKEGDVKGREILLQKYAQEISVAFGLPQPIEIVFSEDEIGDLEAAHVSGTNKVVWPRKTLPSGSMFKNLEIIAHEVNHANQEKLMKQKSVLTDVDWFLLAKERESFIHSSEFKAKGEKYYLSLPTERDSFNAQALFRNVLDTTFDAALETRCKELGLPGASLRKDLIAIAYLYEILGDSIQIKDIESIGLSEQGKSYLDSLRASPHFVTDACKEAVRVDSVMRTHFRDIF